MTEEVTMTQPATPTSSSEISLDFGGAWLRLLQEGASAWTEGCVAGAATLARTSVAQTNFLFDLVGLGGSSARVARWLNAPDELLREELLFAEMQAERLAEGARATLGSLAGNTAPVVPLPLPE